MPNLLCHFAPSQGQELQKPHITPFSLCLQSSSFFTFSWQHRIVCGILVPSPGTKPAVLHWKQQVLTTGSPGKSPYLRFSWNMLSMAKRKDKQGGLPQWLSGKESTFQFRRHRKIPHGSEQLSPCVTTTEPVLQCCRKGNPFQGPKLGSCLTLGNELSEETHVLTKQEILLERAPRWRAVG